jgi:hypothetical protein
VEFVLMRNNLRELPAALRWAAQRGASFAIVSHMLPYDAAHAAQSAFEPCSDAALDLFAEWRDRAGREGIDLESYFKVLWRFSRNPEDQRIVSFVGAMKAAADAHGISLDLRKLFAADTARRGEVAAVLAEAREVAAETGIACACPRGAAAGAALRFCRGGWGLRLLGRRCSSLLFSLAPLQLFRRGLGAAGKATGLRQLDPARNPGNLERSLFPELPRGGARLRPLPLHRLLRRPLRLRADQSLRAGLPYQDRTLRQLPVVHGALPVPELRAAERCRCRPT